MDTSWELPGTLCPAVSLAGLAPDHGLLMDPGRILAGVRAEESLLPFSGCVRITSFLSGLLPFVIGLSLSVIEWPVTQYRTPVRDWVFFRISRRHGLKTLMSPVRRYEPHPALHPRLPIHYCQICLGTIQNKKPLERQPIPRSATDLCSTEMDWCGHTVVSVARWPQLVQQQVEFGPQKWMYWALSDAEVRSYAATSHSHPLAQAAANRGWVACLGRGREWERGMRVGLDWVTWATITGRGTVMEGGKR